MSYKSSSGHDDYTTPKYVWEQIKQFIPDDSIIWESAYCDGTSGSHFEELGFNVIHENKDYFNWEPDNYTIQITNPPYSIKQKWIKRALELGKPWILLMSENVLGTKYLKELTNEQIQIILPKRRINFNKIIDGIHVKNNSCSFNCYYYCYGLKLPKDINYSNY